MIKRSYSFWFLLAIAAGVAGAIFYVVHYANSSIMPKGSGDFTVILEPGADAKTLALDLKKEGATKPPFLFDFLVRGEKASTKLQAGEYTFGARATPREIVRRVSQGAVDEHRFRIAEGSTWKELRSAFEMDLSTHPGCKSFNLALLSSPKLKTLINSDRQNLEGQFFPDTYNYTCRDVLGLFKKAHDKKNKVLGTLWKERTPQQIKLPYENEYDVLKMASLIEEEGKTLNDRRMIAGVLLNRLRKPMRLDVDATLRYADIYKDSKSPYNSYKHTGLPPTPIAFASKESMEAALNPTPSQYFYYVRKPDNSGEHVFSEMLYEQNAHARKFREWVAAQKKAQKS